MARGGAEGGGACGETVTINGDVNVDTGSPQRRRPVHTGQAAGTLPGHRVCGLAARSGLGWLGRNVN